MTNTRRRTLVASYARLSVPDESRIAEQHSSNTAFAARFGARNPATSAFRFSDNGALGLSDADRPALQRLRAAVDAGAPFRIVVAAAPGRLSRSIREIQDELVWFSERGVRWAFASQRVELLTDPNADYHAMIRTVHAYSVLHDLEKEARAEWSRRRRRMRQE